MSHRAGRRARGVRASAGSRRTRTIGILSVGRTDWNVWRPVAEAIRREPRLSLRLYATGMHLSPEFGSTVHLLLDDGFRVDERVEVLLSSDSAQGIAKSMASGVAGFAQVFERSRPDILLVMGDRFETFAAVSAAVPFNIPVAHLHGGESTEGLIDEQFRHALTKLSHIHFAATPFYAARIRRMGEEPWRVVVTGGPGIDTILRARPMRREAFCAAYGLDAAQPFLLVTYHPVTLAADRTDWQMQELLAGLREIGLPVVFTYPNADASSRSIIRHLKAFERSYARATLLVNLGPEGYINAMRHAAAMVGNSSSGIVESASFRLPVVNIGDRQGGRVRARNVIDVNYGRAAVAAGIRRALSPRFRAGLRGLVNPYGDGHAADAIVRFLKRVPLDRRLIIKRFHDAPRADGARR